MGNNTNHGHFFEVGVAAALEFRALVRTPPPSSNSKLPLLLMMEGKNLALTSRRCCFFTVALVDPRRWGVTTWGRRDVGTSRRWNVATLERRDVPATFILCFPLLQLLPKFALFNSFVPAFTELAILRYRAVKIHN